MPNAQVVASFTESGFACLAVRVNEGAPLGQVEYIGRVQMDESWQAMTPAQKKAALVAACKQTRDQSIRPAPTDLGLSGQVSV